jgi:hypothetical protein
MAAANIVTTVTDSFRIRRFSHWFDVSANRCVSQA